jgi:hypothetical protein
MVKVGFICEGSTEFILLQSQGFKDLLTENNISLVNVINAGGSGNLLPHNISGYVSALEKDGAEKIFILTDLDTDVCITLTKQRISARAQDIVVVAVKQIESWFLADTDIMRVLLNKADFIFDFPENENVPFETINNLMVTHTGRGVGKTSAGKIKLITRLSTLGINLNRMADHAACPSATYFIEKLKSIGKTVPTS